MDRQTAIRSAPLRDLLPVRSLNDLDWFVKESEIITGNPGREFVVAGSDQPTFRIHLDHVGYQIARVDRGDQAAAPVCATAVASRSSPGPSSSRAAPSTTRSWRRGSTCS